MSEAVAVRTRNLKPGFFKNETLCGLTPLNRLLFAGLWLLADRCGRLEDRSARIKAELLPYDECRGQGSIDQLLQRLHEGGFILRYSVNGIKYIQILAWDKHQNPHVKEVSSTIPAPGQHSASPVLVPENPALAGPSPILLPPSPNHIYKESARVDWPDGWDFEEWFQKRLAKHPIPGKPQIARGYALEKIWAVFTPDVFDAAHDAWCEYWAGKDSGVPNLATFIFEDWWKRAPPAIKKKLSWEEERAIRWKQEEEEAARDVS